MLGLADEADRPFLDLLELMNPQIDRLRIR